MALHSLKQSYKEWNGEPSPAEEKGDYYPCIYLDEKSLDAMKVPNLRTGTEMKFVAVVRVSSVSDNANGSRSMSLELMEGSLEPKDNSENAASVLFPNG